jgi:hypothetical protein
MICCGDRNLFVVESVTIRKRLSFMTDHDHVFKELLGEFFPEFIDLFFPQVAAYLDRQSIEFQPQEIFADLTEGDTYEADVVVKARFLNQDSFFIIHLEHQGVFRQNFDRRVFTYFAQLHRIHQLPVYPIVIFSHRSPREDGDRTYKVEFPDWEVLRFRNQDLITSRSYHEVDRINEFMP